MKISVLTLALVLAAAFAPLAAQAQERSASLVGYERADLVQGEIVLSAGGGSVLVRGLVNGYGQAMELYLAKGFNLAAGARIGEMPASSGGGLSFDLPQGTPPDVDTVVVTLKGNLIPVGVGLLK